MNKIPKYYIGKTYKIEARKVVEDFDLTYNFLENSKETDKEFIKLFDDFNDGNASKRILDYLERV